MGEAEITSSPRRRLPSPPRDSLDQRLIVGGGSIDTGARKRRRRPNVTIASTIGRDRPRRETGLGRHTG